MKRGTIIGLVATAGALSIPIAMLARQPVVFGGQLKIARSIVLVCWSEAEDGDGSYFGSAQKLAEHCGTSVERLLAPKEGVRIVYRPGFRVSSPPDTIICYTRSPVRFGKHYVTRNNGLGEFISGKELAKQLAATEPNKS